jgi:hypothetical protein
MGMTAIGGTALGMYLYRHPRLRKKLWHAGSLANAAVILRDSIRHDVKSTADHALSSMAGGIAGGLRTTKRMLGSRLLHRGTRARQEMRHLRHEARHARAATGRAARHAKETAEQEAAHMLEETREAGTRMVH